MIHSLPPFTTTLIGSFPHLDADALCRSLGASIDIPAWPQLPRRNFRESMYVQYSARLPGVQLDEVNQKITFNTIDDLSPALEIFYEHVLADDVNWFALEPDYAAGFFALLNAAKNFSGEWLKGHVTGPISFGLTVTDQSLRSSLYNEALADVIVKNMALNTRWQIRQLQSVRDHVIIFVDEPYLAAFGSAFISVSREQVIALLDEVFEALHLEGALAGVHCCANTDWSVLLATQVDILNLDAYGYLENLALYPIDLRNFLDRGGRIAWGIVPNNEGILNVDADRLADRMRAGLNLISTKARSRGVEIRSAELADRSLITPSCGLGSTSIEIADRVVETLARTGEILKRG
ncbi:MAG TPA: methionine synthase [Anaerolineae bacterium]|nr:methionine synthase [Anaerolineae bacterium]